MTTSPVHIYRRLLREATYLPDPRSRIFVHNHVVSSFRRYLPKSHSSQAKTTGITTTATATATCSPNRSAVSRQTSLLARARKFLSFLRRCNDGHLAATERLLKLTYGRIGRRNREILSKLIFPTNSAHEMAASTPATTSTGQDNASTGAGGIAATKPFAPGWQPPVLMTTLLQSQLRMGAYHLYTDRRIKPDLPTLPAKTIWNRPMPASRIANANRKWMNKQTSLLLPPLPEPEWEHIYKLAVGEARVPERKPRRPMGTELLPSSSSSADAMSQSQNQSQSQSQSETLLLGPPKGQTFSEYAAHGRPHKITPRFVRRQMARLLQHTPLARVAGSERKERGSGVVFQWSNARTGRSRLKAPKPTDAQRQALFG